MHVVLKSSLVVALAALVLIFTPFGSLVLERLTPSEPLDASPVSVGFQPLEREERSTALEPAAPAHTASGSGAVVRTALDRGPLGIVEAGARTGFHLRVVDPAGGPVADAVVALYGRAKDSTRTDARGEAWLIFDGERAREKWMLNALTVRHPKFAPSHVKARYEAGTVVELGEVALEPAGAIEGRVLTANGRPAAGAWVEVDTSDLRTQRAYGEERVRRSQTGHATPVADEHGRFRLDGVPVGDVRLWAGLAGELATLTGPIEVRPGTRSTGLEIVLGTLESEEFITVEVRLPDGTAAAYARVKAKYSSFGGSGSRTFTADAEGRFRIAYVPASPRTIRVQDREKRFASAYVEDARGGDHLSLQLLENEYLELTLTGDGDPIAAVAIGCYDVDRSDVLVPNASVLREADRYRIPIPPQPFQVEVIAEGYRQATLGPFDGLAAPRSLEEALLSLPGLRGLVTGNAGPVAGARVELYQVVEGRTHHDGFFVRVWPHAKAETKTRPDGTFRLTFREPGMFYLRVSHADYAPTELGPYHLDPEVGRAGVAVALSAGGVIEGVVRIPGVSAAGRIVAISRGDGRSETVRCDAEGAFRFERLVPGRWQVELADEERRPGNSSTTSDGSPFREEEIAWNCEVQAGETTRFDLRERRIAPVELAGTLTIDGGGAEGWVARLDDDAGFTKTDGPRTALDESGAFTLAVDEPGEYRLSILDPSQAAKVVTTRVLLSAGRNAWSARFDTGELVLHSLAEPAAESVDFLVAEREGFVFLCWLRPGGDAPLRLSGVPAGPCRVTRHRGHSLDEQDVLTGDETRLRVEVRAGTVVEGSY
ncbi:MAG: carboxypeptidase-like regulatory domain-containing protein [Planctomycetota bacterium]